MSDASDCAKSISAMIKEWTQPVLAGGINIPPNLIDRRMERFQPSPAIAALAMQERAAAYIDICHENHMTAKGRNPADYISEWSMSARVIRALPTTFTDAELLAAVEQFPAVRALVDAAERMRSATYKGQYEGKSFYTGEITRNYIVTGREFEHFSAAIAPFRK